MRKKRRSSRPLIGITPDVDAAAANAPPGAEARLIQLRERYARAILDSGGLPLILPITAARGAIEDMLGRLDGVVVSGGDFDIGPAHYGEAPIEGLGTVKEDRTQFELEVIDIALKRSLPLLGICGGAQAINVALGGTLYQDIARQLPTALEHEQGALRSRGGHAVRILDDTLLKRIVGRDQLETNTTHHQAVKRLGKGLIVNAIAEDGVIEGLESARHGFVLGVQWHPEFLADKNSDHKKIFTAFVSAAARRQP